MQDAREPTIMWMGLEEKEVINKSKQKGHIKEAGGGVRWADPRWKLDVEAIIKGICKRRVARCGKPWVNGDHTAVSSYVRKKFKKEKKKKHIGTEKYFPCYFILTKELRRQACFQRGAAISRLRGYGFFWRFRPTWKAEPNGRWGRTKWQMSNFHGYWDSSVTVHNCLSCCKARSQLM